MFKKDSKKNEMEMILTGMMILASNMQSFLKEIKQERYKIELLIEKMDAKMDENPKPKITYL